MPSIRIENVCEFYNPAGGRCNKVGSTTLEGLKSSPALVEPGTRRDYTDSAVYKPSTGELLIYQPVSYYQALCKARGLGGSVDILTVSKQRKCTEYSPRHTAYKQVLRD